jgi:hypothetical protein
MQGDGPIFQNGIFIEVNFLFSVLNNKKIPELSSRKSKRLLYNAKSISCQEREIWKRYCCEHKQFFHPSKSRLQK